MCKWGTIEKIAIRGKITSVDLCIAPIVRALNDSGFETIASCCGHGNRPGIIALRDERELAIFQNYQKAREFDKLYPDIWGNVSNAET